MPQTRPLGMALRKGWVFFLLVATSCSDSGLDEDWPNWNATEFTASREVAKIWVPELPQAEEELDPESLRQFKEVWAQAGKASRDVESSWQRALSDDPLFERAIVELERRKPLEEQVQSERHIVQRYYKEKGEDAFKQFREWRSRWIRLSAYGTLKMGDDPEMVRLTLWFWKAWHGDGKPLPPLRKWFPNADLVEDLLPLTQEELSEDRAVEIARIGIQRKRQHDLSERKSLEKTLDLPPFVRAYLEKKAESEALFILCETYVRINKPEYVTVAEEQWQRQFAEAAAAWPNLMATLAELNQRQLKQAAILRILGFVVMIALVLALVVTLLIVNPYRRRRAAPNYS